MGWAGAQNAPIEGRPRPSPELHHLLRQQPDQRRSAAQPAAPLLPSEHGPGELHLHPTFPGFTGIQRDPANAMIVTVLTAAHRPIEDKRALAAALNKLIVSAVGVSPDDVFIALVPVPIENFSFGRGELQLADSGPRW